MEGVEYLAKAMGFKVAVNATFKQDDQDFVAPVTQLKNAGCAVIMLVSVPGVTGKVLGTAAQLGYAPRWIGTSPSWHHALAASPIKDYLVKNFWVSNLGPAVGDTSVAGVRTMLAVQQKYSPGQAPDFYYYAGYYMGFPIKATLAKAVESGTLTRAGVLSAQTGISLVGLRRALRGIHVRRGRIAKSPRNATIFA